MGNQIMKDKYVLGQSIDKSIASFGQEIRLDVSLVNNPNGLNGGKISGKVIDTNGNPIENALIKIMSSDYEPLIHTLTNVSGEYSFINVEANTSYNIFAIAPGMRLKQGNHFSITNFQQLTIDFVLESDPAMAMGIIAGDLIDATSNSPINGAIITLFKNEQNSNDTLEAVIHTNQYGQFVFREIPIGNYTIKINALGYNDNDINTSIDEGGKIAAVKISLTPNENTQNGTVSGMITNANNQPVDRADVILYSIDSNNNLIPIAFTKTNVNGIYLFDNVPVGKYKVKANEIELITDNGTIWEYSPYFDSFTLSKFLTFNPMFIDITKGDLLNNASLKLDNKFVADLGGSSNGAVRTNITVEMDGIYNLAVKYLSGDKSSPVKIDVNNVVSNNVFIAEKTLDWNHLNINILNIQVMLTKGVNTIKFYNDTGENAPYISSLNVTLINPYITINSTTTSLNSGATEKIQGKFIGNIGDVNNGYMTLDVSVSTFGEYNLNLQYLSGDQNTSLKMDINGVYTGTSYSFNKTTTWNQTDASTFNITVNLMAGNNTIKFYNDINVNSPWIGNITFNPTSIISNYNATLGNLTNGATQAFNNTMISNLGGSQNGAVDLNVNVPIKGDYILGIQYLTGTLIGSPLKIDINGTLLASYMAPYTGVSSISNSKILNIKVPLNQGNNNIKFYNNTGVIAPNIGKITLKLMNSLQLSDSAINGTTSGSAALVWNNEFVGGIGGSGNGQVNINVPSTVSGEFIMTLNYLTPGATPKSLKIDINNNIASYTLPKTNYTSKQDSKMYNISVNLKNGNNIIKFYNDLGISSPDIGSFTLTRVTSFRKDSRAELAILTGSATVKNGLVAGVSSSGGDLTLVANVPESGEYDFTINYTAGDDNAKSNIDVNDVSTGEVYKFNSTDSWDISKLSSKTIKLILKKGNNTIRFYNTL